MKNIQPLSLSTVIALIKKYITQYKTIGIKNVEGVPPSTIKFTLTDNSTYSVSLDLTANGIAFTPTNEIDSTNVQDAIEKLFEKLNNEYNLKHIDLTNSITSIKVDNSGMKIESNALFETEKTKNTVPIVLKIPIKGTENIVIDESEDGKTIDIHLDYKIISMLARMLVIPVSPLSSTKLVSVDTMNEQTMLEIGEGLFLEHNTLKQRAIITGMGEPTKLTDCFLGQMYLDIEETPTLYICTGVGGANYTWKEIILA